MPCTLQDSIRRWASWALVVGSAALCVIILGGSAVATEETPPLRSNFEHAEMSIPYGPAFATTVEQVSPDFTVDLVEDAIWGLVEPGGVVTVERATDGAYGAAEADGIGFFWTPLWQSNGQPADVAGGDTIRISVDGTLEATVPVVAITGGIDVLADEVEGSVPGVAAGTVVTISIGIGGAPGANAPRATATTGPGGSFTASFPEIDLGSANLAAVEVDSGDGRVRGYVYPKDHVFAVQNLRSIGYGFADPGQQVDVTVYEGSGSTVRWSGSTTAESPHGFYRLWAPGTGEPDAPQAGDRVTVDLGGGEILETVLADLSITDVDLALNEVTGTAPAGETVTIRMWERAAYTQTTATADGSGIFTADFGGIADLRARDWFYLALDDAEGNETMLRSGAPFMNVNIDPFSDLDCVYWRVDAPHVPVTITLGMATDVYTRVLTSDAGNTLYGGYGCAVIRHEGAPVNFSPGDTIEVASPTWEGSVEIADLSWYVDSANDEVTGEAPPGDVEVTVRNWRADQYPIGGGDTQAAARVGTDYTATFIDFDVRDGGTLALQYYDPSTDFGTLLRSWSSMQYQRFEATIGAEVKGIPPTAGETITASLYASDGATLLKETSDDHDGDPWRFRLSFWDPWIEPGRWVTVTSESGWEAGLQVPDLTIGANADTDLISGQGPKSLLLVTHDFQGDSDERFVPVDDYALDQSFFGRDVQRGDGISVIYLAPHGNWVVRRHVWPQMRAFYDPNELRCDYPAGHTMSITVTDSLGAIKATATDLTAFGEGEYGSPGFNVRGSEWSPSNADLRPGDRVAFRSDDEYNAEIRVGSIAPDLDVAADRVSGILYAPWFTEVVTGQVKNFHWWGMGGPHFAADPDGGGFWVDLTPHDIVSGTQLGLRYVGPDYNVVGRDVTAVEPSALGFYIGVNYAHDWVNGHCEAGHTIEISVRDGAGNLEATGEVETDPVPGWGGDAGFDWTWVEWDTSPEIDPGDWVYAQADNGETRIVHVGTIKGQTDADADRIEGTIDTPWLEDVVRVRCAGWGGAPSGTPGKEDLALPDDVDTYRCAWDPDTEWDLEPDQAIGVWYIEPDGDHVFSAFEIEAGIRVFLPLVLRND